MLLRKEGFPEEDELVLCTVNNIQYHSVFTNLDEYGKTGLIHISEISPGRIRNIRDFVAEGKKIVCKVLRVNTDRGHIDLSLRRVNSNQKRIKINEIKQEQKAEKIVEFVTKNLKLELKVIYRNIIEKISKKYSSLYYFFEDVSSGKVSLEEFDIEKKIVKELEEAVKQRIKEAEVEIGGNLKLTSYSSNGIDIIKEALKKIQETSKKVITIYEGGGIYKVKVKAPDYKEAEEILEKSTNAAIEHLKSEKGFGEFTREGA